MNKELPTTTLIRISKRVGELTNKKEASKIAKVNFSKLHKEEIEAGKQFVMIFHSQCPTKKIGDTVYNTAQSISDYIKEFGGTLKLTDGTLVSL